MLVRILRFGVFFVTLLMLFFAGAVTASAATVYANSLSGSDATGDGSSGNPYKTFYKAFTTASAGDTIDLTGTFNWADSDEGGDSAGSGYNLGKDLTIQGQGPSSTFIEASSTEGTADRSVFTVLSGHTITLKDLTVRYGVSTAANAAAGIIDEGTLTLENVTVSNNDYTAASQYNFYAAGGIYTDSSSVLTIASSTIAHNSYNGKAYGAGGLYSTQSVTITITGSTFANNTATSSDVTTYPYSYSDPAGGIELFRFVVFKMTNSTIANNSSNGYAGGLNAYYDAPLDITNCTIVNNTATKGAGGILYDSATPESELYLKNTIIADNTGNGSSDDFYVSSSYANNVVDNGYNIVETSTNKTFNATGDLSGNQSSLNISHVLADNSSHFSPQTLALTSGSVAIDAGSSSANNSIAIPGYDERGGTRSGSVDIGAYEYGAGGIVDNTAPTVSLTAPTASATISGTYSVTASASDNVSVAGVTFYVDGVKKGSEDTSSPYAYSWDTTATSDGSHSAFAVARDASNNYATSTTVSFTVDNTAPVFSSITPSTSTSTATIAWSTNEAASARVYYGLTTSYGTYTALADTSPRVTSHSVSLSGLSSCTRYHYVVTSADVSLNTATSSDSTFTTTGCTGSASVSASNAAGIATATGGSLTQGDLTLTVPVGYTATTSTAVFEANQLDGPTFFGVAGAPNGKTKAGNTVFHLVSIYSGTTTLSTFAQPITIMLAYGASDVSGLDVSTLAIYRYDSGAWTELSGCSTNTSARTVSCTTDNFSDFAIFGTAAPQNSGSNSTPAANGMIFEGDPASLPGYVEPRPEIIYPDGHVVYLDSKAVPGAAVATLSQTVSSPATSTPVIATTTTPGYIDVNVITPAVRTQFTKNLYRGVVDPEVRALQEFLNTHGFRVAVSGYGSPGNETDEYGPATQAAVSALQEAHSIAPAYGYFGPRTRTEVNTILNSGR